MTSLAQAPSAISSDASPQQLLLTPDDPNVPRSMKRATSCGSDACPRPSGGSGRHSRRATQNTDNITEHEGLVLDVLDLQDVLRDLIDRAETTKEEYSKQAEENAVLLQYVNNLMATAH